MRRPPCRSCSWVRSPRRQIAEKLIDSSECVRARSVLEQNGGKRPFAMRRMVSMTRQSVTRDRGFELRYTLASLFFMGLMAIQLSCGEARANDALPLGERRVPINVIFDTDMWSD